MDYFLWGNVKLFLKLFKQRLTDNWHGNISLINFVYLVYFEGR